jgi:hypothetical protein
MAPAYRKGVELDSPAVRVKDCGSTMSVFIFSVSIIGIPWLRPGLCER